MISQLLSCSLLALLSGCFGTHHTTPTSYQRSRILVLNQTAIMDTVTAVLDGQVIGLCNQQPLPASVHDALLVPEDLVDVAYNVMREEYQNKGVEPTIKVEPLK
ncbi:MAG: hypothetical protein EOO61_03850 [Hymenobacter sp.]|nr:MAG: hypothetical protein EOO61_03850 [Hymenobacter sp.]